MVKVFLPFTFAPQLTSRNAGNRPTLPIPSPTPIVDNFPNRSPTSTPPPLLSSARRCSLPSPTRSIDHERRIPPPVSVEPRSSSSPNPQFSIASPKKTTFVQSPSRLDSLTDGASHCLRQRLYSSPQSNSPATHRTSLNMSFDNHAPPSTNTSTTSRSLRGATKQHRKAQPIIKAKLPRDLTEFLSPKKKSRNNRQL